VKTIACITTKYAHQLEAYATVLNTLNLAAAKGGARLAVLYEDPVLGLKKAREYFDHEAVSGVIFIGIRNLEEIRKILTLALPAVFLNSYFPEWSDAVLDDAYAGGYLAGRHLLAHGHRRVAATFDARTTDPAYAERIRGFQAAYSASAQPVHLLTMATFQQAEKKTLSLFKGENAITGLFATAQTYFDQAKIFLDRNQLAIPETVSVVCYDANPAVDCLKQQWESIAEQTFKRIVVKMENPAATPATQTILPELLLRGSVRFRT
jgi:DNA-binding LacI/PurR family transcriptional regulator